MTEPELLVDEAQGLEDRGALFGADLDVGEREELEDLVLGPPDAAQLILGPASGRRRNDLALRGALARPAAGLEIGLENLDRSAVVALVLDFLFAQGLAPGLLFGDRFGAPPALASSATMRFFKASFSSRAAAAIVLSA